MDQNGNIVDNLADMTITEKRKTKDKKVVIKEFDTTIKLLRERISKSSSREMQQLLEFVLDDQFLLKYLRAREFDVEQSYQLVKGYFAIRKSSPEMFRVASEGKFC